MARRLFLHRISGMPREMVASSLEEITSRVTTRFHNSPANQDAFCHQRGPDDEPEGEWRDGMGSGRAGRRPSRKGSSPGRGVSGLVWSGLRGSSGLQGYGLPKLSFKRQPDEKLVCESVEVDGRQPLCLTRARHAALTSEALTLSGSPAQP